MTLPEGTVTFLRSDIEGSMELVRSLGARYDELNAEHAALVRAAVAGHGGHVVRTEGDAFFVVFSDAGAAARAAVDIQRAMAAHTWPAGHEIKLRIGIHTGSATRAGDDYGGFEVNRAARIAATGWGGQIVVSDTARALIATDLPDDWSTRDLGQHRLKGVSQPERLFQLDAPGIDIEFPGLRSSVRATDRLPQRLTSLIGREDELEHLSGLLAETRLLTLTGPGGTGKTTLALELARRHADEYADGTWFVDLQSIRDVTLVKAEIAHGSGLFDSSIGSAAERLYDYIAEREVLIVIDNFEQVVEAASTVAEIAQASPRSRIIVTSRIPLRLQSEQEAPIRPLGLEAGQDQSQPEAVRLFIERVRRVRPDLSLDDSLDDVHAICRLLDGLPLAIELTAARASVLPITTIRSRLEQRLPLPGQGPRDLPARQRTIHDTIAWSVDLLDPPLRRLLSRLAVFEESVELEQAELVCGPTDGLGIDVLGGLAELTERSLLTRIDDGVGGVRFGMLETVRAFAAELLASSGEAAALRARHADAYAELAAREYGDRFWPVQPSSLERLDADDANLRAAVEYLIERGDDSKALMIVADLWRYWIGAGRLRDGVALAEAALRLPGHEASTVARIRGLDAAGGLYYWTGDMPRAHDCYREQLQLATSIGDRYEVARAWFNVAFTRALTGDVAGGTEAMAEAQRLFAALGDEHALARCAIAASYTTSGDGLFGTERLPALREIIALLEGSDDPWERQTALGAMAQMHVIEGDMSKALAEMVAVFRIAISYRDHSEMIIALKPTAMALLGQGEARAAAIALGASEGATDRYGIVPPASLAEITGVSDPEALFIAALDAETFASLRAEGRRLSLEQALAELEAVLIRRGPG